MGQPALEVGTSTELPGEGRQFRRQRSAAARRCSSADKALGGHRLLGLALLYALWGAGKIEFAWPLVFTARLGLPLPRTVPM